MNELINQLTSKAGISTDQAQQCVQVFTGFLKDKLPAPLASQVQNALGGQSSGSSDVGGMMNQAKDSLGGMFGGSDNH